MKIFTPDFPELRRSGTVRLCNGPHGEATCTSVQYRV